MFVHDLTVCINGEFENICYKTELENYYAEQFQPVDECDDVLVSLATGGISEQQMKIVTKRRKDAAKYLAEKLAGLLLEAMEKNDTKNGYRKD